jgi:hypothetical protein
MLVIKVPILKLFAEKKNLASDLPSLHSSAHNFKLINLNKLNESKLN